MKSNLVLDTWIVAPLINNRGGGYLNIKEVTMNQGEMACDPCHSKHEDQVIRLRKIEGQVKGVQKMIYSDRYCIDILMQIKSIKNALIKVEENILKRHIETCVQDAIKSGSESETEEKISELIDVISRFSG